MIDKLRDSFVNPQDEYTPIPFWFWNDNLEEKEIKRQIHDFKDKGVMGFVIHPRIGIPEEIQYLSDRFMELVKFAVEEAADLGMKVVLYDEAMYPSGSAHGMVVKDNPEYASRGLKVVEYSVTGKGSINVSLEIGESIVSALVAEKISDKDIDRESIKKVSFEDTVVNYDVPAEDKWCVLVFVETYSEGTIRGIHFGEDDGEKNAPPSGDLLNKKAMEKFISLTHDRYYEVLSKYFGNTIIAMFTDEPGILGRAGKRGLKPWTSDFLNWYLESGNREEDLAFLWYEGGDDTENIRKNYRKAVNKKLEETYYKPISQWCEDHNIALTGHPEKSDEIGFLKYFHIPGQDVVWRWIAPEDNKGVIGEHSTMGKCSSDAARHIGRTRNSNECFGCCGPDGIHWAFSAADMKWYFDWLFIRGVNLVYPHAFFYSIDGPGRFGERPPDVGPNNIWWKHYKKFSDYIKRMCYIMTDSYNTTEIAILCEEDFLPWKVAKPLYENQIEFNYLEDNLLLEGCTIDNGSISIEKQKYRVLIIEDIDMLSEKLNEKLNNFIAQGGSVILLNSENKLHNLRGVYEIEDIDKVIDRLNEILVRDVTLTASRKDLRVSHVVKDEVNLYCIVNEGSAAVNAEITLSKVGYVEKWNPWTGVIEPAEIKEVTNKGVTIPIQVDFRGSLVLCVDESREPEVVNSKEFKEINSFDLNDAKCWKVDNIPQGVGNADVFASWTTWKGMEHYSGTISYSTKLTIEEIRETERVLIDFGEVHEICELYVNGIEAGVGLWAPYRFDITSYIKTGENVIELKINNTLANRIEKTTIKSGLLGPVKVIVEG